MSGKADKTKDPYVSIQSENKPGLYITANKDHSATLAQDTDASEETAMRQTFRTIKGLAGNKGVSFESIAYPGYFLAISNGILTLQNGQDKEAATFYTSIYKEDTSLLSIAATTETKQVLQSTTFNKENISLALFYANGIVKNTKDFTTNASSFTNKKPGNYQLSVIYKEGLIEKTTMVPITIIAKPSKVKNLEAKVSASKKKIKVLLTWDKAEGQKYEISYGKNKNQHKELGTFDITEKKADFSHSSKTWKKGKSYYFHIKNVF